MPIRRSLNWIIRTLPDRMMRRPVAALMLFSAHQALNEKIRWDRDSLR
jgi:hypothetical protein